MSEYYKLAKPDGWDFFTGNSINYRDNIGKIINLDDCIKDDKPCGHGIHVCKNPNDCFIGAKIPCSAYKVKAYRKNLLGKDNTKSRFSKIEIIEEIIDLNELFGWNYTETINPINPINIKSPEITQKHIDLLKEWASVMASMRASVMASVRASVMASVWASVRDSVWASVEDSVRASVVAYIGSLFSNIKKWKYIDHEEFVYPFQPAVDLWKLGLVTYFDGNIWRLHGGENIKILWDSSKGWKL